MEESSLFNPETDSLQTGKWYNLSPNDVNYIKRGDYVKILFHPYSQKHFFKDDFPYYFPIYFGKIMSSSHSKLEDLLIKDSKGKSFYYEDRAGTSAMVDINFYRPSNDIPQEPENHPYYDLIYNSSLTSTFIIL